MVPLLFDFSKVFSEITNEHIFYQPRRVWGEGQNVLLYLFFDS